MTEREPDPLTLFQQHTLEALERGDMQTVRDNLTSATATLRQLQRERADLERRALLAEAELSAMLEACTAFAEFVESYSPDSELARVSPSFYGLLRVYGKNARAAVQGARAQAQQIVAELDGERARVDQLEATIEQFLDDADVSPLILANALGNWPKSKKGEGE